MEYVGLGTIKTQYDYQEGMGEGSMELAIWGKIISTNKSALTERRIIRNFREQSLPLASCWNESTSAWQWGGGIWSQFGLGPGQRKKSAPYARLLWDLSVLCKHCSHLMTTILSLLRNHYGFPNNVHWALHVNMGTYLQLQKFSYSQSLSIKLLIKSLEKTLRLLIIFSTESVTGLCMSLVKKWKRVFAGVLFTNILWWWISQTNDSIKNGNIFIISVLRSHWLLRGTLWVHSPLAFIIKWEKSLWVLCISFVEAIDLHL